MMPNSIACFSEIILQKLTRWRTKNTCKPLVSIGARQVGETTVIMQFSTQFKAFV
jgi:hypothetical protein